MFDFDKSGVGSIHHLAAIYLIIITNIRGLIVQIFQFSLDTTPAYWKKKQMFRLLITVQCWIEWMLATYYHWYNGSCPHVELIFLRFVDPDELPDIVYCFEEWEHIVSIVRLVCYYETDKFKDKQNKGIIITHQISLSSIEFGLFTLIGPSNLSNVGAN